jgi:hypothetical protein
MNRINFALCALALLAFVLAFPSLGRAQTPRLLSSLEARQRTVTAAGPEKTSAVVAPVGSRAAAHSVTSPHDSATTGRVGLGVGVGAAVGGALGGMIAGTAMLNSMFDDDKPTGILAVPVVLAVVGAVLGGLAAATPLTPAQAKARAEREEERAAMIEARERVRRERRAKTRPRASWTPTFGVNPDGSGASVGLSGRF